MRTLKTNFEIRMEWNHSGCLGTEKARSDISRVLSSSCDLNLADECKEVGFSHRHPMLEERLRDRFGHDLTEAHLKMAEAPAGASIIFCLNVTTSYIWV